MNSLQLMLSSVVIIYHVSECIFRSFFPNLPLFGEWNAPMIVMSIFQSPVAMLSKADIINQETVHGFPLVFKYISALSQITKRIWSWGVTADRQSWPRGDNPKKEYEISSNNQFNHSITQPRFVTCHASRMIYLRMYLYNRMHCLYVRMLRLQTVPRRRNVHQQSWLPRTIIASGLNNCLRWLQWLHCKTTDDCINGLQHWEISSCCQLPLTTATTKAFLVQRLQDDVTTICSEQIILTDLLTMWYHNNHILHVTWQSGLENSNADSWNLNAVIRENEVKFQSTLKGA